MSPIVQYNTKTERKEKEKKKNDWKKFCIFIVDHKYGMVKYEGVGGGWKEVKLVRLSVKMFKSEVES